MKKAKNDLPKSWLVVYRRRLFRDFERILREYITID